MRALPERIQEWRLSDKAGYDQAIGLLCEAEAEVLRLSSVEQALREALKQIQDRGRYGARLFESPIAQSWLHDLADMAEHVLSASPEAKPEEGQ